MLIWKRYPALYVALLVLIGIISAFFLPFITIVFFFKKRLFWIIPLLILLYVKLLYPTLPKEDIGKAHFRIEEVKRHVGPIKTTLVYIGKIKTFTGEKGTYRHLPARLYLPLSQKRFPANKDYLISGTLKEISLGHYLLKPVKKTAWIPIKKTTSPAEWRYEKKQDVKKWVYSRFKEKKVRLLMSVLATGNLESYFLSYKFNAIGIRHLLVISGFHFALLSFLLTFILKRLISEKLLALSLIFLLSSYFFYMGAAPSVSRSWIAVLIYFIGLFFHLRSSLLNTFGIALLAILLFDPLVIFHISFQLSFGATLGLLLFYRSYERFLQTFFPKRPFDILLAMPRLDQCGYLFCTYLRSVIALQGAILSFTLPILLFHFQTFPLASLFYNLFLPFLFSILLVLFFLHLDFLTAPFASFLLSLIEKAPKKLLFSINPLQAAILSLPLIFFLIIKSLSKKEKTGF